MKDSIEKIKEYSDQIGNSLALPIDIQNPDEIKGKMNELQILLALSSHCVALSEMIYNEKVMLLTEDNKYTKMTATDKKLIFAGKAKEEIYYMTLCERQNKAITHSIDALRSALSYEKEQLSRLPQC